MSAFEREIYGRWATPDPLFEKAVDLWRDYYRITEAYDQVHCSGRTERGVAVPNGPGEMSLINNHAKGVMIRVDIERCRLGIPAAIWAEAKHVALRELP